MAKVKKEVFDVSLFKNAHRIIVSPGVALTEPALVEAKKNNIEIIEGFGKISSPNTIEVKTPRGHTDTVKAENIMCSWVKPNY